MIYYRKTLFGRGPKLTAVHYIDEKIRALNPDLIT
jgi:hypothetical protein